MSEFRPKRRDRAVKVEDFQGEVLVYDLESHRAHCLNGLAVAVWRLSDGRSTVAEIASRVAAQQDAEADEDLIWRALSELDGAALLATPIEAAPIDPSRRQALAQLGWAAGIPLVLSIAVPSPAYSQSAIVTAL